MNTMKNKVQIIGHVGAAPEIKKLENGKLQMPKTKGPFYLELDGTLTQLK